jgi:gliding motility-associated-like protein
MAEFSNLKCFTTSVTLCLLIIVAPVITTAQICNGSLGDPAVNITFGKGASGPSPSVPSASYIYVSDNCPNDGSYTITNYTSGCFGNSWLTLSNDHTGGGNFMLVNASYEPGDFFLTTVTDLCPNTTYEFAAWVVNVINRFGSIYPNLTFKIEAPDGTVLGKYETGDIPVSLSPDWKQYGFFFTTPQTNATIVLRITNNAPGGIGNDLALDDITFRPCGAKITAGIQGVEDTVNVCTGNTDIYTFNSGVASSYVDPVYRWQSSTDGGITWQDIPGATNENYVRLPTGVGIYLYRLTITEAASANIASCRIASNVLMINVHDKPSVDAGPDRTYIYGYPVTLTPVVTGEEPAYLWTPDFYITDVHELMPDVTPPVETLYTLSVTSAFGCSNKDSVNVKSAAGIFVPNAFTPNGDGRNDRWNIPFLDPAFGAEVTVFNRWGQVVYHASPGQAVSWDGKVNSIDQGTGTYIYLVVFKNAKFPTMKGTLTLLR